MTQLRNCGSTNPILGLNLCIFLFSVFMLLNHSKVFKSIFLCIPCNVLKIIDICAKNVLYLVYEGGSFSPPLVAPFTRAWKVQQVLMTFTKVLFFNLTNDFRKKIRTSLEKGFFEDYLVLIPDL